ncbi:MBL fold metallo-hydrolase [Methylobacterium sp. E-041]|uniref:ComEC/Rec2 family competence protein n=1 Tax=Methylobacterium sp. E-041 TaxID=2836573 RepID=UPI001FB8BB53|nr:MBL fold metallo-hydrolase [Methylobacterium sp. E-041]MCJ2109201.1 MBL fold metallo-hydrolase [Methylobacterium sp. E-041]
MKCEIEFLPVGDASKAGDAIVIRYGEPHDYKLMLVDGGHATTGDQIVGHLRRFFGPGPVLEHVVLTHADGDHASGLRTVFEQIPVLNLWMHAPWLHAAEALPLFANKLTTGESLTRRIKGEYDIVSDIYDLADRRGCAIRPAFAGSDIGPFRVLSPDLWTYLHLLPQFEKTPDPDQPAIERQGLWIGKSSPATRLFESVKASLQSWTTETWDRERLRDGGITSASNESSVVLYGSFEGGPVLLTGDAGDRGLGWAAEAAVRMGLPLQGFQMVQVPHHGSRRNSGPTMLNRILGPIQPHHAPTRFYAYVSAPTDDSKHPRNIVLNAFARRGGYVIATQGSSKVHWGGFPVRPGYTAAAQVPFFDRVEEYT